MLKATVEHLLKATVKHINAINIWYHMHDVETLGVAFSRVNCDIYEMMFWDVDAWYDVVIMMLMMWLWWCLWCCYDDAYDVVYDDAYDDVMMCYNVYVYELDVWLLILTYDLYINIIVVNLTPSAGIAALWASAGSEG